MPRTAHSASPAAAVRPVEHMAARCADPASSPTLFAGMTAVASTLVARRVRRFVALPRWVHPAAHASSCPPHRLTVARARCRRPSELFTHGPEGAEQAAFVTEKVSSARQRSWSSLRTCSSARRSRAAADELPKAAAAARKPPARPHGPRRPAEPVSAAFVECRVSPWVGSGVRRLWRLSGRKGRVRESAYGVCRRPILIIGLGSAGWT